MKTSGRLLLFGLLLSLCVSFRLRAQESVIRGREILVFHPPALGDGIKYVTLATDASGTFGCAWAYDPRTPEGGQFRPDQLLITRGDKTGRITRRVARLALGPGDRHGWLSSPDLAMNCSGSGVVVWEEIRTFPDSQPLRRAHQVAFTSLLTRTGAVSKSAFRADDSPGVNQRFPTVSIAADGSYAVAWEDLPDQPLASVACRRFNSLGDPAGEKILLESSSSSRLMVAEPDIAVGADGCIVAVWTRVLLEPLAEELTPERDWGHRVRGVLLDKGGKAVSRFGTSPGGLDQWAPRIAMNDSGRFVVVWADGDEFAIRNRKERVPPQTYDLTARLFDIEAKPITEPFKVNGSPVCGASKARISTAIDSQGRIVVVWQNFMDPVHGANAIRREHDI
ncbi:MAG: hypothetical protein JXP34_18695 [Planctomycetes bacterium]|nr:hypothetical protein [Planctomycetota bacterium]